MDFASKPEPVPAPAPAADPDAPITRPDVSFVTDDGGWDTWLWSQMPWSAPMAPDGDLVGMEKAIDAQVGEDGLIGDFNLIGHGAPGNMRTGDGLVSDPEQIAALQAIAGHMAEDSEIVLGGCNFARDPAAMARLAEQTDQTITAGTSIQLPFPGIEGTTRKAIPSDIPGEPPIIVEESSMGDKVYDFFAGIAESLLYTPGSPGDKIGDKLASKKSIVDTKLGPAEEPMEVMPPIQLPPE